MKTIAFETATQPGSLALLHDDNVVCDLRLDAQRRTTESFALQLHEALQRAGWRPREVGLFAVCEGPGSFTGLRIGVTAAKTFAYATGCELVALNTLEVLVAQAGVSGEPVWGVLNAQRQQLFVAAYRSRPEERQPLGPTQIVPAREWIGGLTAGATVTGDGLRAWTDQLPPGVTMISEDRWNLSASTLGQLAVARQAAGQTVDLWQLVPRYYRQSAAEEKRQAAV